MTGAKNGFIMGGMLLHCNELPLRHIFSELDGTMKSAQSSSGPIGKELNSNISDWPVKNFNAIQNEKFPKLLNHVIQDLSNDQYYGYRLCLVVMSGSMDQYLHLLQIGPIVHSRGLTLACRILRFYTSTEKLCKNLVILAELCFKVYFPSWFSIKYNKKITYGPKKFFNMIKRICKFQNCEVRKIALRVLDRNAYILIIQKTFF